MTITNKVEKNNIATNKNKTLLLGMLINSKIVDTGKYEYFVSREKLSEDPRIALTKVSNAKKDIIEYDSFEYIVAKYSVGNIKMSRLAIQAAATAHHRFKRIDLTTRVKILLTAIEKIKEAKQKIVELMMHEGLPKRIVQWEFKEMTKAFSLNTLEFYKSEISRCIIQKEDEQILLNRKPDGVLGVFLPKNAPASSSMLSLFALLSGNTLVLKPPYKMPVSVLYIWQIIDKVILDMTGISGVINVIVGNSKEILEDWLSNEQLNDLLYFGDSVTGMKIGLEAYKRNKKAILELSGNDFLVTWKDADIANAINSFCDGYVASSQVCILPRTALVHHDVIDEFVSQMTNKTKEITNNISDPDNNILCPVGNMRGFDEFLKDACNKGAKLLIGGQRIDHLGKIDTNGKFVKPALLYIDSPEQLKTMKIYSGEVFFPLLTIVDIKATTDDDIFLKMCNLINSSPFGLRTSVWVKDEFVKKSFVDEIKNCGMLRINSRHVGFSEYLSTHGGVGLTGGPYGSLNYLWEKTSHIQGISLR